MPFGLKSEGEACVLSHKTIATLILDRMKPAAIKVPFFTSAGFLASRRSDIFTDKEEVNVFYDTDVARTSLDVARTLDDVLLLLIPVPSAVIVTS